MHVHFFLIMEYFCKILNLFRSQNYKQPYRPLVFSLENNKPNEFFKA